MSESQSKNNVTTKYRFWIAILLIGPTIGLIALVLFFGQDTTDLSRLDIINSLLAVFGVWVGAVIAFYFGSENMELAQRGIKETIGSLRADPLKTVLAEEAMLTPVYKVTKDQKISETINILESKSVNSVVVVDDKDKPLGILYKSEIMEYIAKDQKKYDEVTKEHTIDKVITFLKWENGAKSNFLPAYPNNTIGSIKTNMENRKIDYAIVLGPKDEAIGILSRLEILKQASIGK